MEGCLYEWSVQCYLPRFAWVNGPGVSAGFLPGSFFGGGGGAKSIFMVIFIWSLEKNFFGVGGTASGVPSYGRKPVACRDALSGFRV